MKFTEFEQLTPEEMDHVVETTERPDLERMAAEGNALQDVPQKRGRIRALIGRFLPAPALDDGAEAAMAEQFMGEMTPEDDEYDHDPEIDDDEGIEDDG